MIGLSTICIVAALGTAGVVAMPAPEATTTNPSFTIAPHDFHAQLAKCPVLPPRTAPPRDVSDLRPDDFSVIMGMGDSVMAAVNSRYINVPEFTNKTYMNMHPTMESRGSSFATGIDPDAFSIAHIINSLRVQSGAAPLIGTSRGNMPFEFCSGPLCPSGSCMMPFNASVAGLNSGQSGSWVVKYNIKNQFRYFDRHYKDIAGDSRHEPWKLLIYEHGFNNLCFGCNVGIRNMFFTPDKYEKNVRYVIRKLHRRHKKMVIVLMGPFLLSQLHEMVQKDEVCKFIHSGFNYYCPCLFHNPKVNLPIIDKLAIEYNRRLAKIAADYKRKGFKNFAVVYDPGMGSSNLTGATAIETISGRDCFHPTLQTHARFAAGLWNNLFTPSGQKKTFKLLSDAQLRCPTADDRIAIH